MFSETTKILHFRYQVSKLYHRPSQLRINIYTATSLYYLRVYSSLDNNYLRDNPFIFDYYYPFVYLTLWSFNIAIENEHL